MLLTTRLELRACTEEIARASLNGAEALQRVLGRSVPGTWPPGELKDALALDARNLARHDGYLGWGVWLVLRKDGGPLVGSAGFKGPPDDSATVEIGYGIEPAHRRMGFATEAVRALVEWAWTQEAGRVVAECHPANHASIGVLERIGMHRTASRAGMLWWELRAPS